MLKPKDKFINDMQSEISPSGFIGDYLNWMRSEDPRSADRLEADLIETFTAVEGLRVLKLFEKAILNRALPSCSDDRALRELNAVRLFILEIRRLVAHGAPPSKTQ